MDKFYKQLGTTPKIGIADNNSIKFIELFNIIRCEADGKYTQFYLRGGIKETSSKNLGEYEEQLNEHNFLRVHDSHIINLDKVVRYIRGDGGEIVMNDDTHIPVSRAHKSALLTKLNIKTGFRKFFSSFFEDSTMK